MNWKLIAFAWAVCIAAWIAWLAGAPKGVRLGILLFFAATVLVTLAMSLRDRRRRRRV